MNAGENQIVVYQPNETMRLDLLLEYAVEHGDEAEAARLREELKRLTDSI